MLAMSSPPAHADYHRQVHHDVHRVHRVEHALRRRQTPYMGYTDWRHKVLWHHRRIRWDARYESPRWVIPAVFIEDPGTALRVVSCESGFNPAARNPYSTATGLFQILGGPTGVWANTLLAHQMYRERGWEPWTASEPCWG